MEISAAASSTSLGQRSFLIGKHFMKYEKRSLKGDAKKSSKKQSKSFIARVQKREKLED